MQHFKVKVGDEFEVTVVVNDRTASAASKWRTATKCVLLLFAGTTSVALLAGLLSGDFSALRSIAESGAAFLRDLVSLVGRSR